MTYSGTERRALLAASRRADDAKLADRRLQDRIQALEAQRAELLEALRDMLSGWIYIRGTHGDLYGVGWDRAQGKAEAAISKAGGTP